MAEIGAEGALPILWSAAELPSNEDVPTTSSAVMEAKLGKAQPKRPHLTGTNEPINARMTTASSYLSTLSRAAPMRHYLRQEPGAAIPLARIRGGGSPQGLSLPRHGGKVTSQGE